MATESKEIKRGSIGSVYNGSKQVEHMEQEDSNLIKIGNRRLVWVVGGFMSAVPWILSGLFAILYEKSDPCFAAQYRKFQESFVSEGSFLWLSITVLAMSLVEILLNGFRENVPQKTRNKYNALLVLAAIIEVGVVVIYFLNIGKPIGDVQFVVTSIATFIVFIVLSWVILFKIVK